MAQMILTSLGLDLAAIPSERHSGSWLGRAPCGHVGMQGPAAQVERGLGLEPCVAALRMDAVALQRSHSALGATFRRVSRRTGDRVAVSRPSASWRSWWTACCAGDCTS